jgi:hypothetical protein
MSDDKDNFDNINIVGGSLTRFNPTAKRFKKKRIIKADKVPVISRVMTIGGECADDTSQPPSIIIERDGDQITRIIVKCTCGRHAELICDIEEESTNTRLIEEPPENPHEAP